MTEIADRQDPRKPLDVRETDAWYAKQAFRLLMRLLRELPTTDRAKLQGRICEELLGRTLTVDTCHGPIAFVLLSEMAAGRALSLLRKQPHTLAWIDRFQPGSVFWDIGANIGVYSLYAGRRGDVQVVAFEPAAVNYFILAANCEANQLDGRVQCLLVGLSDERRVATLGVSQFAPAESFSFGERRGRRESSTQAAFLVSLDALVEEYGLPCPNYIKIDAPALTIQILVGAQRTLQRPDVRELHIEATTTGKPAQMLAAAGFVPDPLQDHAGGDVTFVRV